MNDDMREALTGVVLVPVVAVVTFAITWWLL